jgi:hypothetical protein
MSNPEQGQGTSTPDPTSGSDALPGSKTSRTVTWLVAALVAALAFGAWQTYRMQTTRDLTVQVVRDLEISKVSYELEKQARLPASERSGPAFDDAIAVRQSDTTMFATTVRTIAADLSGTTLFALAQLKISSDSEHIQSVWDVLFMQPAEPPGEAGSACIVHADSTALATQTVWISGSEGSGGLILNPCTQAQIAAAGFVLTPSTAVSPS